MVEQIYISKPEDYLETEVGIIPSSWNIKPLGDVSFIKGRIGWQGLKETEFTNNPEEPFLITGMNFKDGKIRWNEVYHVSWQRYDIAKEIQLQIGDVLMTKDGTIGKVLFVDTIPFPNVATLNSHLLVFRPLNNNYYPNFLYYQLLSKRFKDFIELNKSGTTFFGISQGSVSKYSAILPSIFEQTAIATALYETDALIEKLEKLIAKKRNIKQGAMQELLKPKNDWLEKTLEEISDKKTQWSITGGPFGSNLKASDYTSEGIRIIQLQNIGDGKFVNDNEVYTSINKADELLSCNIFPNEIILSKMGDPVARACIVPNFHSRYLMCSDGIRLVVDREKYDFNFIYLSINSPKFRKQAENSSTGSTRKRIGLTELKSLKISCPTKEVQTSIAQIITDMNSEIEAMEQKLQKYRMIKQGMMQALLTGKIRLI